MGQDAPRDEQPDSDFFLIRCETSEHIHERGKRLVVLIAEPRALGTAVHQLGAKITIGRPGQDSGTQHRDVSDGGGKLLRSQRAADLLVLDCGFPAAMTAFVLVRLPNGHTSRRLAGDLRDSRQ